MKDKKKPIERTTVAPDAVINLGGDRRRRLLVLACVGAATVPALYGPTPGAITVAVGVPGAVAARALWRRVAPLLRARAASDDAPADALVPSAEECEIGERLDPSHWVEHAEARGLGGTVTGHPELTPAGVVASVRLDGTWTVAKLRAAEPHVRALLGCRDDLAVNVASGGRGGWARITCRTRSAADGADLVWRPGMSWGVDTVTGDDVQWPIGKRILLGGTSGAGKSVTLRPGMWDASDSSVEHRALAVIDLKMVEGRLWEHRARVAYTPDAAEQLVDELVTEMFRRLAAMPRGTATWVATAAAPRITLIVDEGAEVMPSKRLIAGLSTLARMGRAALVDVVWATQKPTFGDGVDRQVAGQLAVSVCLKVKTAGEARVVLGENATADGWAAEKLPMPGYALLDDGKRRPDPIRVRFLSDEGVVALPSAPVWSGPVSGALDDLPAEAPVDEAELGDVDRRVVEALREADGPVRQAAVVEATGILRGTVSKAVKRLVELGVVERDDDGRIAVGARAPWGAGGAQGTA